MTFAAHPLAARFPRLDLRGERSLLGSIEANGQLESIVLLDGLVLDGRARLAACARLGLAPRTIEFREIGVDCSPLQYMIGLNVARRQLSKSQLAVLALDFLPALADEAAARQRAGTLVENPSKGRAADHAARMFGVSSDYVYLAQKLARLDPQLLALVRDGRLALTAAIQRTERARIRVLAKTGMPASPPGLYDLINADPSWPEAGLPYLPQTLDEIKGTPIPAAPDALLALWTTHNFVLDSRDVLQAWGFEYARKLITWAKRPDEKRREGRWNRRDTEFLVIGTRGEPPIDLHQLRDLIPEPGREHSRKPDEAYRQLEALWPGARRLDVFSRERREGWTQWGIDPDFFAPGGAVA